MAGPPVPNSERMNPAHRRWLARLEAVRQAERARRLRLLVAIDETVQAARLRERERPTDRPAP